MNVTSAVDKLPAWTVIIVPGVAALTGSQSLKWGPNGAAERQQSIIALLEHTAITQSAVLKSSQTETLARPKTQVSRHTKTDVTPAILSRDFIAR